MPNVDPPTTSQRLPSMTKWRAFDRYGDPIRTPLAMDQHHLEPLRCECGAALWINVSQLECTRGHPHGPAYP